MFTTTMTLQRAKVTQRTGIPMQVENMAWKIATDMGGQSPYDSFWIYTTGGGTLDVRRADLLIDEQNTDPLTGNTPTHYRVFGNPEGYFQTYTRIPAEKVIGV